LLLPDASFCATGVARLVPALRAAAVLRLLLRRLLPYLPLALVAMIAAGAGFLILAPTLLFVIHTRRVCDEGARCAPRWAARPVLLLLAVALALLPRGSFCRPRGPRRR